MITKSKCGATLIEVLVAVLIFMIGLEALMGVILQNTNMGKRAEYAYTAYTLAKNHIERLRVSDFASLATATETSTRVNADGDPDSAGQYLRSTAVAQSYASNTDLTRLTVSVSWIRQGVQSPAAMQVDTVIYNGG